VLNGATRAVETTVVETATLRAAAPTLTDTARVGAMATLDTSEAVTRHKKD
jgi:hypothetical protein